MMSCQNGNSIRQAKATARRGPEPNPSPDAPSVIGPDGRHYSLCGQIIKDPTTWEPLINSDLTSVNEIQHYLVQCTRSK